MEDRVPPAARSRSRRFRIALPHAAQLQSLRPVQVYCKFVSTDTPMLRAARYVGADFDLGGIVRGVAAE